MDLFNKKTPPKDLASRQAILWMHPTSLVQFMTSARWVVVEGHLPEDVTFQSVFYSPERQVFGLICISKEFKVAKAGVQLPDLPAVKFRYWNAKKDGEMK